MKSHDVAVLMEELRARKVLIRYKHGELVIEAPRVGLISEIEERLERLSRMILLCICSTISNLQRRLLSPEERTAQTIDKRN